MQPTMQAVTLFEAGGWNHDALEGAGYITKDGQPTQAILDALLANGHTADSLLANGLAVEPSAEEAPKADAKVARYIAVRDEIAAAKSRLKEQTGPLEEELTEIEQELSTVLSSIGQTSMKSDSGTFFYADKELVGAEDYNAFQRWFLGTLVNRLVAKGFLADGKNSYDAVDAMYDALGLNFLTQAVRKEAVIEYTKEHGNPPPGLKVEREQVVQVRRPTGKPKK